MAPNIIGSTFILAETAITNTDSNNNKAINAAASATTKTTNAIVKPTNSTNQDAEHKKPYQVEIVWHNILLFIILHSSALYGLYLVFAENAYVEFALSYICLFLGGMGITAGVHRLWSHRAYKAKLPLRIFLMLCQSLAFQNCIYEWTRDHRVHHKFTDTDADPHNSRRGFFFAHMGWLLCKKHPDVKEKGKQIDMSDLKADPVVMFQKKYYFIIMPVCCFVLPALFPYYYLGSSLKVCFFVGSMLRYCISLHGTWLVNSAAHFYGMKPYDKNISSVNNKVVSSITFGEGWHNYHHVFPWDYKAAELGNYYNMTTAFLNIMARIGQAYDLKTVSDEMILKRIQRTGDGTHPSCTDMNNNQLSGKGITAEMLAKLDHENEETMIWGWEDKDVSEEDRKCAKIIDKKDD
ncbi:acyl-CoA Delta-9 desaturase [Stomoxys calcitrans]|uniref:Fatty acid desaturase domain-containing protein n=1 Tax=Stomoxys calcitrans TaxID=35570 RepID=A0A1I8QDS2_STOCA|nr:acyl-CoA Delta-9 desaturase [Stomoxys calcitrans]